MLLDEAFFPLAFPAVADPSPRWEIVDEEEA